MGDGGSGRNNAHELYKLKQRAVEYYRTNNVPQQLEDLLNSTFYLQPPDVYGHLANCFSKLAKPPTIYKVIGRIVLDGMGHQTLRVEIFCTVQNQVKSITSAVISSHLGVLETVMPEVVDQVELERNEAISVAVQWVNESMTELLEGLEPTQQEMADQLLANFFANKVQEDKESKELELSLEQPLFEGSVAPQSSPPSPPLPPKKKGQRGRKEVTPEKPIPPAEPPEPILHGSMAIGAVSLAVAKTCATLTNTPLYSKIASLKYKQESPRTLSLPLLMVTMLSCGKSSSGKLNLMKEVICIPHPGLTVQQGVTMLLEIQKQIIKIIDKPHTPKPETKKGHNGKKGSIQIVGKLSYIGCLSINYDTIEQPLLLLQGICGNLGLELGINLYLAINCAAHELIDYTRGKYEVTTGVFKNPSEMVDIYVDLINKFPSITALIDPVRKEDIEQWGSICNALGSRCNIIAGTASKSVPKLLEEQNVNIPKSSGLIIKHTNQTTISNLIEVTNLIESQKRIAILGSTEGESSDDSLADLAVGLGVRFLKLGGLSRGERMTKYNRLFTIEEELVQSGTLTPTAGQTFIDFSEEDQKAAEAFVTSLSSVSTGRAESDVTRFSIKSEAIK
ncbi:enolase 4 isoform X1 [Sarcophilus harrisii]|uniref:Enolase 4 n=1 Tax=Sarcophilus harrisii TaxID=9305 RepID=G3WYH3_SARHA|nr:enolase 4 isoform X1 [Sarcophilus harrisii]